MKSENFENFGIYENHSNNRLRSCKTVTFDAYPITSLKMINRNNISIKRGSNIISLRKNLSHQCSQFDRLLTLHNLKLLRE